jgi:hypothetical protein
VQRDGSQAYVLLRAGRHEFIARDPASGEVKRTHVIVHDE